MYGLLIITIGYCFRSSRSRWVAVPRRRCWLVYGSVRPICLGCARSGGVALQFRDGVGMVEEMECCGGHGPVVQLDDFVEKWGLRYRQRLS